MQRIVITGVGTVTSIGTGVPEFWQNLLAGKHGMAPVVGIDAADLPCQLACEVRYGVPGAPPPPGARDGRATALLAAAINEALAQSGLDLAQAEPVGLCVGTTMGEIGGLEQHLPNLGANVVDPSAITVSIADQFRLTGPAWTITNACAAGNYAIAKAFDDLQAGRARAAVAGGVDVLSWVAFTGFNSLRAMARTRCQPFDKNREGIILGEGAGALVLETAENALARGAAILAEVIGYGLSCDAHHPTQPDPEGMARAMWQALEHTRIRPDEIGYVSAHGTGTPNNDRAEARAMSLVFGARAPHIPISSIKAQIGHTLGAASAIEAITCVQVLQEGMIPATMNLETLDPDCPLDVVPNQPRAGRPRYVLSNAYAFGGNNSSLVLGAWTPS